MHFYTTATSSTLAQDKADELIWRDVVPLDGFAHEFLVDAILALAALHKAVVQPASSASKYTEASVFYQQRGLREFTKLLAQPDASNCHALFAFP